MKQIQAQDKHGKSINIDFGPEGMIKGTASLIYLGTERSYGINKEYFLKVPNRSAGRSAKFLIINGIEVCNHLAQAARENGGLYGIPHVLRAGVIPEVQDYGMITRRISGTSLSKVVGIPDDYRNLDEVLTEKRLVPSKAISIYIGLLAALRDCHKEDVVHSDVIPENVYIDEDGRLYLWDFDNARRTGSNLTEFFKGKLRIPERVVPKGVKTKYEFADGVYYNKVYAPPEIRFSKQRKVYDKADARNDIFMATNLLHILLTGRPVVMQEGKNETDYVESFAPPLPLPDRIVNIITTGLGPFQERYFDVDEVLSTLAGSDDEVRDIDALTTSLEEELAEHDEIYAEWDQIHRAIWSSNTHLSLRDPAQLMRDMQRVDNFDRVKVVARINKVLRG